MERFPSGTDLKRLAYACNMEYGKQTKNEDHFGPLLKCVTGDPDAFVTRVLLDPLRREGSKIATSDGTYVAWTTKQFECFTPSYRQGKISRLVPPPIEHAYYYIREFCYYDATYVATHTLNPHTKKGSVIERVFLFINQPGFDIETVIERMRIFRWKKEMEASLIASRS